MFYDVDGPIQEFSWGKFVITGKEHSKSWDTKKGVGKDIRLIGTEVTKWSERKGHLLSEDMITKVFDQGIETLIIGLGASGALVCPTSVQDYIRQCGIPELILRKTPKACKKYNEFYRSGKKVALLAHGTC
jgi:hypothetical protein